MSVISLDATPVPTRCGVCRAQNLRRDEVDDNGLMILLECGRCGYRTTHLSHRIARNGLVPRPGNAAEGLVEEVATAA